MRTLLSTILMYTIQTGLFVVGIMMLVFGIETNAKELMIVGSLISLFAIATLPLAIKTCKHIKTDFENYDVVVENPVNQV